jgi:GTPase SAR1 family protein
LVLKIILIGDSSVGKSCLLKAFMVGFRFRFFED